MESKTAQEVHQLVELNLTRAYDRGYDDGHKAGLDKGQARYDQGWIDGANAAIARQGYTPLAGS